MSAARRRGAGAAGRAGLVALAAGAACGSGGELTSPRVCPQPLPVCAGGAALTQTLAVSEADAAGLELVLCKNGACATRRPSPVAGTSPAVFACDTAGPVQVACQLAPSGTGMGAGYTLTLRFAGSESELRDGDTYALRVGRVTPGAPAILERSWTVTRYDTTRIAPEGCAPLCRTTTLTPT